LPHDDRFWALSWSNPVVPHRQAGAWLQQGENNPKATGKQVQATSFLSYPHVHTLDMSAVLTRPTLRSVSGQPLAVSSTLGMSFSVFAQLSESVAVAARHVGLVPPGFQSLAKGVSRRLVRRTPAGPIIAVKVRGRSTGSVLVDLVEGVLAVSPNSNAVSLRLAQEMYAFLGVEGWPIPEDRETEANASVHGVQAA
jgi:hypothetical protein